MSLEFITVDKANGKVKSTFEMDRPSSSCSPCLVITFFESKVHVDTILY